MNSIYDPTAEGNENLGPLHEAAVNYAAAGVAVFPCQADGKRPATMHGFGDATTDLHQIAAWWRENPRYNVAIVPESAGWGVVDLDVKGGGVDHWRALDGEKPATYTVATPGGGRHLYYKGSLPPSVSKLAPGIDTRGRGSYVLVPPSIVGDIPYVVADDADPAPLPEWITERLGHKEREAAMAPAGIDLDLPGNVDRARQYLADVLRRKGPWGEDDPPDTYAIAGVVKDAGLSEEMAVELMMTPLPESEREWLSQCVRNAYRYGQNAAGAWAQSEGIPAAWQQLAASLAEPEPEKRGQITITAQIGVPVSEDDLAKGFAERFAHQLCYVDGWGRWLEFDGRRWASTAMPTVWNYIRTELRPFVMMVGSSFSEAARRKLLSKQTISNVEQLARGDLLVHDDLFDAQPWLLNTPAGIVDLRTGEVHRATPEAYCTKMTATAAGGACPLWRKFLAEITGDDAAMQTYLQRLAGYSLVGRVLEHVLLFLYGTGANGKGVFLGTLTGLLGDYAKVAPIDTFTETTSDRHPTDLAMLRGMRLVTAQETDEGRAWAEAKIKALTGGDKITARFMRQDFFEFTPQFTLLIAGNHKPKLRNVDEAIRRRLHMVPFAVTIPPDQRDGDLPEKLKAEWPGILQWAIDGCLEWQRIGLAAPSAVTSMTADYFDTQDPLSDWLQARCDLDRKAWTSTADLFRDYLAHMTRMEEKPEVKERFSARLESRGLRFERRGKDRARGYAGVALRPVGAADAGVSY